MGFTGPQWYRQRRQESNVLVIKLKYFTLRPVEGLGWEKESPGLGHVYTAFCKLTPLQPLSGQV